MHYATQTKASDQIRAAVLKSLGALKTNKLTGAIVLTFGDDSMHAEIIGAAPMAQEAHALVDKALRLQIR
jgi:hypothetical protein